MYARVPSSVTRQSHGGLYAYTNVGGDGEEATCLRPMCESRFRRTRRCLGGKEITRDFQSAARSHQTCHSGRRPSVLNDSATSLPCVYIMKKSTAFLEHLGRMKRIMSLGEVSFIATEGSILPQTLGTLASSWIGLI